ncbi:hypothetical protein H5410_018888 [Solanum commersonii]|uniref:Uncharacterized protein n=1 Tax=Solanum commersonii TaxID=4109 RepID=A0A9J6A3T1_SOLCO|nr:hypothetical protein H5410_018888 [Solanum commersonii]
MCYSEAPYWDGNLDKREHRGRYLSLVQAQVSIRGAGTKKFECVCSPTIIPGSFRCRHHRDDYKWVARFRHKA